MIFWMAEFKRPGGDKELEERTANKSNKQGRRTDIIVPIEDLTDIAISQPAFAATMKNESINSKK
jgi:hypothetical protein